MQNFTPDMNDDELDRLFREAASAHQPEVPADNWQEIARRLKPSPSGKRIFFRRWLWMGIATATAAGWLTWKLWLRPEIPGASPINHRDTAATHLSPSSIAGANTKPQPLPASQPQQAATGNTTFPAFRPSKQAISAKVPRIQAHLPLTQHADSAIQATLIPQLSSHPASDSLLATSAVPITNLPVLSPTVSWQIHTPVQQTIHLNALDFRHSSPYRWSFSLTTGPAWAKLPDESAGYSSFGTGWLLNVKLLPRLHLEAGMLFTRADYNGTADDYHIPFTPAERENIKAIQAACKITDVPLNLQWDLLVRPRQRLFISAGLSSYFMRKEDYRYAYKRYIPGYPWHVSLYNVNEHYFSVGNLAIGFEEYISPHFSVQAEPYFKLPLSGIGYGEVKLQSFGAWFAINYHF